VLEPGDNFETILKIQWFVGAGPNNRATVEFVVENAPIAIERLVLGVPFNLEGNDWHLTREVA
jgi:L-aspartate oxidase